MEGLRGQMAELEEEVQKSQGDVGQARADYQKLWKEYAEQKPRIVQLNEQIQELRVGGVRALIVSRNS